MPNPSSTPVAILGPTGYTGLELIKLLQHHPAIHLDYLASQRSPLPNIADEFPSLRTAADANQLGTTGNGSGNGDCEPFDHDDIAKRCTLAFLCLPHEAAMAHAPELLARGVKVVDLSAAYRIKDTDTYARYYGHPHTDPDNLARAVYSIPELSRDQLPSASLVANPGCYPTAATLSLVPLLRNSLIDPETIVINAASGVSGAGRAPKPHLHFPEAADNFSAYATGVHRHQPEIFQNLTTYAPSARFTRTPLFCPHLLPVNRGILETITAEPASAHVTTRTLAEALHAAYATEPFVTVRTDKPPALRDVQHTNNVHIHAQVTEGRVVLIAAIDNLVKGASGQAIQNANAMLGVPETAGLL